MKIYQDVSVERVASAVERSHASLDNPGFCVICGAEVDGVEPDARRYECEVCGEPGVHGVKELLIRLA